MTRTHHQRHVIDEIIRIGRRRQESRRAILAALATGRVESGYRNLHGSQDGLSAGWRQERTAYYSNPRNLRASINRFYNEADRANPSRYRDAGQLAAAVQRPAAQYAGRYNQSLGVARNILSHHTRRPRNSLGHRY